MDILHVVIDTSILRRAYFGHPDFERLLRRSRMGALRLYIPHLVLEEQRTFLVEEHDKLVRNIRANFEKLQRTPLAMLTDGLPPPAMSLWQRDEVARNSQAVFARFVEENKIEVIPISMESATEAWRMYFEVEPPFNANQDREARRKDIPDSWIFVAARGIKAKKGRHCALVADNKLKAALAEAGFEIYDDIETLDSAAAAATAVTHGAQAKADTSIQLHQLRSTEFKDIDVIVLGVNEALNTPLKADLFAALERAGVKRAIAEHEAQTLVLSGRLTDTGGYFVPTDRALARQAMASDVVTNLLLEII